MKFLFYPSCICRKLLLIFQIIYVISSFNMQKHADSKFKFNIVTHNVKYRKKILMTLFYALEI